MSPVISVEHLSKTYPSTGSPFGDFAGQRRLGQIGTPSESTRPLAAFGMLREGELPAPSRATWNSGGPRFISPPRISRIARRVKHLPRIYPEGYDVTNWANGKKQFEKFV